MIENPTPHELSLPSTLPEGYLEAAARTAIYSPQWAVLYPALGLGNEAAELAEKVLRVPEEPAQAVLGELGDVLWYVAALARDARVAEDELVWTALPESFTQPWNADRNSLLSALLTAAGNAQGHVKKALRDHDGDLNQRRDGLVAELRQVLVYADALASAYGTSLHAVAAANIAKLADRAARNTLQGDGDVR